MSNFDVHQFKNWKTAPMLKLKNTTALVLPLLFGLLLQAIAPGACADTVIPDPVGDTFGTGSVQHDITGVSASSDNSDITFMVKFAGSIFASSTSSDRNVYGFIDIDTDRNASTGSAAWVNQLSPSRLPNVSLGDEYWLDLFSEEIQPGRVAVVNQNSNVVGTAPITYGADTLSVIVPLTLLGNSNGLVNYGVIAGTFAEATDRAPNESTALASSAVPEPATWLMLGIAFAGAGAMRLKKSLV